MKESFVAEILRATGALRSGDPADATDIIRAALTAGGLTAAPGPAGSAPDSAEQFRRPEAGRAAAGDPARPRRDAADLQAGQPAEPPAAPQRHRLRRSLGDTIRKLSKGRTAQRLDWKLPERGSPVDVPMPEGAEFRTVHYSGATASRRYRLYVPASAGDDLQGLIVMLHGCTQGPEDFAAGTGMNAVAEANRLLVAYPAQTKHDNPMACWNWFRPGDQMRGAGEPAIIAGLTESIRAEFGIPEGRVFVAGLSAGGAMAAIMGETYPDLYSAVGVHSGLAFGSANDVASAFSAMQGEDMARGDAGQCCTLNGTAPRVIVFHGSADRTVHPANAGRIIARQTADPTRFKRFDQAPAEGVRGYSRLVLPGDDGVSVLECWMIDGANHAWSGGHPSGSYTDPRGPNASAEMVRFFLDEH